MDFNNSQNGFGFPPLGDEFGPDLGFPGRFGAKEPEEVKPTDEVAILQIIDKELESWKETNKFSDNFYQKIKEKLINIFRSESQKPNVQELDKVIQDLQNIDTNLSEKIEEIAKKLLSMVPEIPEMQTNSYYKNMIQKQEKPETTQPLNLESTLSHPDFQQTAPQTSQQLPQKNNFQQQINNDQHIFTDTNNPQPEQKISDLIQTTKIPQNHLNTPVQQAIAKKTKEQILPINSPNQDSQSIPTSQNVTAQPNSVINLPFPTNNQDIQMINFQDPNKAA